MVGADITELAVPATLRKEMFLKLGGVASGALTNVFPVAHDFPSLKNIILVCFL